MHRILALLALALALALTAGCKTRDPSIPFDPTLIQGFDANGNPTVH